MDKPTVTALADKAGISKSYACEILGERIPALHLAAHIFARTGWKHPSIAAMSPEALAEIARAQPWTPPATPEQASAA